MAALSLHSLALLLVEAAEPLLGGRSTPTKKHVDSAVKEAEGQTKIAEPAAAAEPAPRAVLAVADAVSTGQVVRLSAEPPIEWDAAAAAWTCPEPTRLSVACADGQERVYHYPSGTVIPVAAGMIHFPRCLAET